MTSKKKTTKESKPEEQGDIYLTDHGVVRASNLEDALKQAEANKAKVEDGDGK